MSLATLARKTRAKQRLRTRGNFILNMTGRGNVLGLNAKTSRGNCKGSTKCAGKRAGCCVGVGGESDCCQFPGGGQPAPQMGYGVYLNRKSKGAYHPSGGKKCKTLSGCERAKTVWKQGSNLDASVVTTNRRDNTLACYTDVYTAKKDTCTGCPPSPPTTATMMVKKKSGTNIATSYGFGFSSYGSLSPQNVNGVSIININFLTISSQFGEPVFMVSLGTKSLPTDFFTSISFVDSNNIVRSYSTARSQVINLPGQLSSLGFTVWAWNAAATDYTEQEENNYWLSQVNQTLTVNFIVKVCCCPVKKNICGCRATDLVRYTRINKSFGCQTTKAIRQGRSASEQIARRRAAVDCIKPKHRTIYMNLSSSGLVFDGCCGNQCLIPGQQYTFHIKSSLINNTRPIYIFWCGSMEDGSPSEGSIFVNFFLPQGITIKSFTVPKFNTSSKCAPSQVHIYIPDPDGEDIYMDYCKQAFKKPLKQGC